MPEQALPDIVIPEPLLEVRKNGMLQIVRHPPEVDCIHVLARSGTLAAAGLYEDPGLARSLGLPPLLPIQGFGREIYKEWSDWMAAQDRKSEVPDAEILGYYVDEKGMQRFVDWVMASSSPGVAAVVDQLRRLSPACHRIAIVDDVRQFGLVTSYIAPAIYQAAYGGKHHYDLADNRYIFAGSLDWLPKIITATFEPVMPGGLNRKQTLFFRELAKGGLDWHNFTPLDPNDIRSLAQLAYHCAVAMYGYDQPKGKEPPESVYGLIEQYGLNLFKLHEALLAAFRLHTAEVLAEAGLSVQTPNLYDAKDDNSK